MTELPVIAAFHKGETMTADEVKIIVETFAGYPELADFIQFLAKRTDRKSLRIMQDLARLCVDIQELGK